MRAACRPAVLFLAHRVPYPPDKGDRIRSYQILRWLAPRAEVHLACLADEPVAPATLEVLHQLAARVAVVPVGPWSRWGRALVSMARGGTATEGAFTSPAFAGVLDAWAREARYHVVLASASSMIPYLRRPALRATPAVVDLVDVDSQKWLDYAESSPWPQSWLYRLEGRRLRRLERPLPAWARGVLLSSEAEKALYRGFADGGTVVAINNGVDLDYFRPAPQADAPHCVFVGALDYRPNVDAAGWFCREAWPLIRKRRPDARLSLVGRRPAPAILKLARIDGVEVIGQVPDVRPHLAAASVVVVPLRIARGVQNKVLEGLAVGRAVVASPGALAGVRARPGEHLLSAETPAEWADAVTKLFDDPARRAALGAAGRRYVEEQHRWERCLEPLSGVLDLPPAAGEKGANVAAPQCLPPQALRGGVHSEPAAARRPREVA
jgi:sugar transferase (PEP-CTERM/EpsH1 system associated)